MEARTLHFGGQGMKIALCLLPSRLLATYVA